MSLQNRIIAAREALGWQQKTLANTLESCGIMTQQSLSALESGRVRSTRNIWELARILGVNARWLATGEGKMQAEEMQAVLPPASDALMPLLAKLYRMDKSGQLPAPMIEGLLRMLDALQPLEDDHH